MRFYNTKDSAPKKEEDEVLQRATGCGDCAHKDKPYCQDPAMRNCIERRKNRRTK